MSHYDEDVAPDFHATFGSSTAGRTLQCPGWHKASEGIPRRTSSYAERGTRLHNIREFMVDEDVPLEEIELDDEDDREPLETVTNWFDDIAAKLGEFEFETESFVFHAWPDTGGRFDFLLINDENVIVGDYKFGYHGVDARGNPQGLFIFDAMRHHPEYRDLLKGRTLTFVILQPALGEPSWFHMTLEDIEAWGKVYAEARENALSDEPRMAAGPYCQFCPAAPYCKVKREAAVRALTLPSKNREILVDSLALARELEGWIRDVFAEGEAVANMGVHLDGWKLVQKRATQQWENEDDVLAVLPKRNAPFFTHKLMSPTQMRKAHPKRMKKLEQFIIKRSSGTTLVPEDDKRPEVKIGTSEKLGEALSKARAKGFAAANET